MKVKDAFSNINYVGQWLWQSGSVQYQKFWMQPSSATFRKNIYLLWTVEKTKRMKKECREWPMINIKYVVFLPPDIFLWYRKLRPRWFQMAWWETLWQYFCTKLLQRPQTRRHTKLLFWHRTGKKWPQVRHFQKLSIC